MGAGGSFLCRGDLLNAEEQRKCDRVPGEEVCPHQPGPTFRRKNAPRRMRVDDECQGAAKGLFERHDRG